MGEPPPTETRSWIGNLARGFLDWLDEYGPRIRIGVLRIAELMFWATAFCLYGYTLYWAFIKLIALLG